jgi:hypothetical protein
MRTFDAENGNSLGKRYKPGNYQQSFSEYLENAKEVRVSHQPNLENECKNALPSNILKELREQFANAV